MNQKIEVIINTAFHFAFIGRSNVEELVLILRVNQLQMGWQNLNLDQVVEEIMQSENESLKALGTEEDIKQFKAHFKGILEQISKTLLGGKQ